ncbi:hypothetical protein HNR06_000881 [Nocardiopsis arvandica]|uniref:DUF4192 domain-containing protein n=1 Tax=Nocardiopsis sinuspersici TaxID=501010 RepID=A0A7Y9X8R2_9ACTN|nr:DUF4192 domain-containing protein [Nocardiopsis sinuspersici]NYH51292.1 hypothetical protein [Nocardiopsis sinuspersici]
MHSDQPRRFLHPRDPRDFPAPAQRTGDPSASGPFPADASVPGPPPGSASDAPLPDASAPDDVTATDVPAVPAVPPPRGPVGPAPSHAPGTRGTLVLTTPTDIIATLPYLVGAPPDPGFVVLAMRGRGVHSAFRGDLDRLDAAGDPLKRAAAPVDTAASEGCTALVIVAYGPPERVTPYVDGLLSAARERALTVLDALRVTEGRYWSYTCGRADCCPAGGTVVNVDSSTIPADAVLHGLVPVQPLHSAAGDAARVRALLEPVGGEERTAMDALAEKAEARARLMLERGMRGALTDRGLSAALAAVRAERSGRGITGREELAWLGTYLTETRVRDEMWARITAETAPAHQELWSRVARHLPRRLRAAPASLLAVAAWQRDDRALAAAALDAALTADPGYSMAVLMSRALAWGLPVERWREFTPRWLRERSEYPEE